MPIKYSHKNVTRKEDIYIYLESKAPRIESMTK